MYAVLFQTKSIHIKVYLNKQFFDPKSSGLYIIPPSSEFILKMTAVRSSKTLVRIQNTTNNIFTAVITQISNWFNPFSLRNDINDP